MLQERLNRDTGMLSHQLIQQPKNFLSTVTRITYKFSYMYYVSPALFWRAVMIPIPATILLSWAGVQFVRRLNRKIRNVHEVAAAGTIDILKEMTTVRQFAMEEEEYDKYGITNMFRRTLERNMATGRLFTWGLVRVAFNATQIAVTYYGLLEVIAGTMDSTQLLIIATNLNDVVWGIRSLIDLVPQMIELMEPIERVSQTLDAIPRIEPQLDVPPPKPLLKPAHFRGHLVFNDVGFTYPTEMQKPVLKGFSFEVRPGQKVACVGKAGCGKSTSIGLLQRLYVPDSGTITIDGEPIEDYDVHFLRRSIGIVAQDNVLFSTSIKENICYGMGEGHLPMPTDEEVWEICEKANAREFIETFPNLLNTHVGERGVKLSGGQKQRIAIARAMIRKPSILMLDEATSALDPVNEKVVQRALDQLMEEHNGCAIVIAHRLTTVKNCDNIVVMENGEKVEEGPHDELLKIRVVKQKGVVKQGFYHNQWDTQMGEESFATPEHMSDEQLAGRRKYVIAGVNDTMKEIARRQDPSSVVVKTPGKGGDERVHVVAGSSEAAALDLDYDLVLDVALASNRYPFEKMTAAKNANHTSLMAQFCTDDVFQRYKNTVSSGPAKWTIARAINTGVLYPESFVGCHAGDKESYDDFKDFFHPLIEAYHEGFKISMHKHVSDMSPWKISANLSMSAKSKVISTRIRVARSLAMFPLNPGGTRESRMAIADLLEKVYDRMRSDSTLGGSFYRHSLMSERRRQSLIRDHFLFKGKDPMQAASGYHEHWPHGRGVFHNNDKTFINWVNEGDHLRIISMEEGSDVISCFGRLSAGIAAISEGVCSVAGVQEAYMTHPIFGNVTCCPSNLGSGLRGSVHIQVPNLIQKIGACPASAFLPDQPCIQTQCRCRRRF